MTCKKIATFIIPFYGKSKQDIQYLDEAIQGLFLQEDKNWQAIIIDDLSNPRLVKPYLLEIEKKYFGKIKIFWNHLNQGAGVCRNIGIEWAFKNSSPIVLFNDADDISHPQRLQVVRKIFENDRTVDLVYSTFKVINERGNFTPFDRLTPSILEILQSHELNPVEGYNAWKKIGTVTGYTCLTSSTSVRTSIAYECLFPRERVSEDSYAWMHISAQGNKLVFTPSIPTLYRIPNNSLGSTSRSDIGSKRKFYEEKARVDIDGFLNALNIALDRGTVFPEETLYLKKKFLERLAETLAKEEQLELAEKIIKYKF